MNPLEHFIGGFLVGTILTAILLGAVTIQVFRYFSKFPKDPLWMKAPVLTLVVGQFVVLGWMVDTLFNFKILPGGNFSGVKGSGYAFSFSAAISAAIVNTFFAYRIKLMIHQPWLTCLIFIAAFVAFSFGMAVSIEAEIEGASLVGQRQGFILVTAWSASRVVAEVMIAGTMVIFLCLHHTGFPRTDRTLNMLALYAAATGLVPSAVSLALLFICTFYRRRVHFSQLCLSVPLGAVFTFTLLANLLVRNQLRAYLREPGAGAQSIHSGPSRISERVQQRQPLESPSTKGDRISRQTNKSALKPGLDDRLYLSTSTA